MSDVVTATVLPALSGARGAFAQMEADEALRHLHSALQALQGLSDSLQRGERLPPESQRQLERSLLRLRVELRDAGVLAEQGLAYCKDWAELLFPPPDYQANGEIRSSPLPRRGLSLEA